MPYSETRESGAWIRNIALALLAALALLGGPAAASAEPAAAGGSGAAAIGAFHRSAESLYEALRQTDRLQATRALKELEDAFRSLPMTGIATAEGVQALAGSVTEMKRALVSVTPDDDRIEQAAGALRLAADALANSEKPIWLQYRSILREDVRSLEAGLGTKPESASPAARKAFESVEEHYRLIRTAAALSREPYVIERADSVMRYAERVLKPDRPDPKLLKGLPANIREAMEGLFPSGNEEPTAVPAVMPPTWGFTATIGSIIVTILSWAGWRRYRYDRDHPKGGSGGAQDGAGRGRRWLWVIPPRGSLPLAHRARRL